MFNDDFAGKFLFHYTTLEAFLGHILPSLKLRLSPMAEVNDPRESKDWFCSISLDDPALGDFDFMEMNREFSAALKNRTKILCLTMDDPELRPERPAYNYGRGYAHPRMWDRYAGGHTGVCLAFDRQLLEEDVRTSLGEVGSVKHMPVRYSDFHPHEPAAFHIRASAIVQLGMEAAFRQHQEEHFHALYFIKSFDWATEYEYRYVLLSNRDARHEYVNVSRSLAGVVFGPDYPADSVSMVRRMLSDGTYFGRILYNNGQLIAAPAFHD